MASIIVSRGGRIGIRFSNGQRKWTRVSVRKGMSESAIRSAINKAKRIVIFDLEMANKSDMAKEARDISASSAASSIHKKLNPAPAARPAARPSPRPKPVSRRKRRRSTRTRRRTSRRRTTRRRRTPSGPKVTASWIATRLGNAVRGSDYRAKRAASTAHSSRLFVGHFLSRKAQRGVKRTANQRAATIAVFKALYRSSEQYRLLLSARAAMQLGLPKDKRDFSGFNGLHKSLIEGIKTTDPAARLAIIFKRLDNANDKVLQDADLYIRYFLFKFAAGRPNLSRYKREISQLPGISRKLSLIARYSSILTTATGKARSNALSAMRVQLAGTMDAETLTASILYLRRWTLEHPKRGKGKSQARISLWTAPKVTPVPRTAKTVPRPVARTTTAVPAVIAMGDSITALRRYAGTLQKTLGKRFSGARAVSYGKVNDALPQIAARFKMIVSRRRRFNTLIIQGGANGITGISVLQAKKAILDMIKTARANGIKKIIVLGITPWAGWKMSKWQLAQTRTLVLNNWMKTALPKRYKEVVFVDTSPLGEPYKLGSKVLKLKKEYDKGDGLHLNYAGHDRLAALIAQAAYNIAPKPVSAKAVLQQWAAKHWKNLKDRLFTAVRDRKAADIVKMSKNLPSRRKSLKKSLDILKRDDIQRAYDRVFNDLLRTDGGFARYCLSGMRRYRIGRFVRRRRGRRRRYTQYELNKNRPASDRRLIAMTIKKYINHRAAQKGDLAARLKGDLRKLMINSLKLSSSKLAERSPVEDAKTLAAIAVYRWRMANPKANIGAWDKPSSVPVRTGPIRRTVPRRKTPAPRKDDTGRRRKTINI